MSGNRTQPAAVGLAVSAEVRPAQFSNLEAPVPAAASEQANIGLLMDVDLQMTVELGSTTQTIREILGIDEGSVIELDQLAGEPVAILVNHQPIARGEVVVIDDNLGVRVTEIIARPDRMGGLQQ